MYVDISCIRDGFFESFVLPSPISSIQAKGAIDCFIVPSLFSLVFFHLIGSGVVLGNSEKEILYHKINISHKKVNPYGIRYMRVWKHTFPRFWPIEGLKPLLFYGFGVQKTVCILYLQYVFVIATWWVNWCHETFKTKEIPRHSCQAADFRLRMGIQNQANTLEQSIQEKAQTQRQRKPCGVHPWNGC